MCGGPGEACPCAGIFMLADLAPCCGRSAPLFKSLANMLCLRDDCGVWRPSPPSERGEGLEVRDPVREPTSPLGEPRYGLTASDAPFNNFMRLGSLVPTDVCRCNTSTMHSILHHLMVHGRRNGGGNEDPRAGKSIGRRNHTRARCLD